MGWYIQIDHNKCRHVLVSIICYIDFFTFFYLQGTNQPERRKIREKKKTINNRINLELCKEISSYPSHPLLNSTQLSIDIVIMCVCVKPCCLLLQFKYMKLVQQLSIENIEPNNKYIFSTMLHLHTAAPLGIPFTYHKQTFSFSIRMNREFIEG